MLVSKTVLAFIANIFGAAIPVGKRAAAMDILVLQICFDCKDTY
jgi:hypothetical protein